MLNTAKEQNDLIREKAIKILQGLSEKNELSSDEVSLINVFLSLENIEYKKIKEYEGQEKQGILLIQGTGGVFEQYEPFGTIFCDEKEDYEKAKAAIEKQIPKRPDFEGDGYADGQLVYDTWICPCCEKHYEVDYDDYAHCPDCGQKIDWSEQNERT